jgi:hypothetical protein
MPQEENNKVADAPRQRLSHASQCSEAGTVLLSPRRSEGGEEKTRKDDACSSRKHAASSTPKPGLNHSADDIHLQASASGRCCINDCHARNQSADGIHVRFKASSPPGSCIKNIARHNLVRRSASDDRPLLDVYTSSTDSDDWGSRPLMQKSGGVFERLKSLLLPKSPRNRPVADTYTYVDTSSRMMVHSHGLDSNIVYMF